MNAALAEAEPRDAGTSTSEGLRFRVRLPSPSEIRWVQATWSRPLRDGRSDRMVRAGGLEIAAIAMSRAHTLLVDDYLARATVMFAVMPDDESLALAWICFEGEVLHYVFVVPEARRMGIAKALVKRVGCKAASHMTDIGRHLEKYIGA